MRYCPQCGKKHRGGLNGHNPFCSQKCEDLYTVWLREHHNVKGGCG